MPFERYIRHSYEKTPIETRQEPQHAPSYHDYVYSSARVDPLGLDSSIFSSNVQFQMPQLMLGPTVAPGGGAEVLPAGIVGNTGAIASTWMTNPNASRYGGEFAYTMREPVPVSQPLAVPSYYGSQAPTSYTRSQDSESIVSSRHASIAGASGLTPPSTSSSAPSPIGPAVSFVPSQPPFAQISSLPLSLPYAAPSASGLPIYSTSGFDLLSILARVATRPNPKISLGPVDMTCSFAVVDTRRYDHPIVYASPTFFRLTGYSEDEVVGRNCRFLQSPDGHLHKGEERRHTSPDAVAHMRKSLAADKECQISLINYRKNGTPFINLVTVIPIPGGVHNTPEEADDVVYHVGFQVDLTEQPNAILQKLRDGSYMVNYSNNVAYPAASSYKDWKANPASMVGVSKQLRTLLSERDFVASIPLSTATTTLSLAGPDRCEKIDSFDGNRFLSLVLLECTPDFVLVLSLKGAFQYVAPAVRRVLGFEPEELAGRSITDFCHEADVVPLMRELKDSSTTALTLSEAGASNGTPKVVDLLFRMRAKGGAYLWIECRGRLHVEPGKGRKAIILSGRVRCLPELNWGAVARAGGLRPSVQPANASPSQGANAKAAGAGSAGVSDAVEQEFWALLSSAGCFLSASDGVRDVLGWSAGEVIGRALGDLVSDPQARIVAEETLALAFSDAAMETRNVSSYMKHRDGTLVPLSIVFYHPPSTQTGFALATYAQAGAQKRPLVCQIKTYGDPTSAMHAPSTMAHGPLGKIFEELDVARNSSWQYELQGLKYANQRLMDEIEELEAQLEESAPKEYATTHMHQAYDHAWNGHIGYSMSPQAHMSLKRSWDGTVVDGGGGNATQAG